MVSLKSAILTSSELYLDGYFNMWEWDLGSRVSVFKLSILKHAPFDEYVCSGAQHKFCLYIVVS